MYKFNIGDKVKVVRDNCFDYGNYFDKTGTVVIRSKKEGKMIYLVKFNEIISLHVCERDLDLCRAADGKVKLYE